jgi:L-alanine-DL-glutamate epimerase-like enolase superfamily enzyme
MIESIRASRLEVRFRHAFSHASATREATQTIWVCVRGRGGLSGYGEGCPREYVTGETLAGTEAFVARHADGWREKIDRVEDLVRWARTNRAEVDANPAAWCAVELAFLDFFGRHAGRPVEALLGRTPLQGRFCYTAVIGDGPQPAFEAQLARYREAGFRQFKVKLAGERDRDAGKVLALRRAGLDGAAVRADANNLWRSADEALQALRALDFSFYALEEPLPPGDYAGMAYVADALGCSIVLDESLARADQLERLDDADRWIANVRVSKMGGVLRSLEIVEAAVRRGVRIIVGAHVGETSVLARAALTVAAAATPALVAQEGAFGTHLLERDVADPPLMFGPGGVLDAGRLAAAPGWGLNMVART